MGAGVFRTVRQQLGFAVELHQRQDLRLQPAGAVGNVEPDQGCLFGQSREIGENSFVSFGHPSGAEDPAFDAQHVAIADAVLVLGS